MNEKYFKEKRTNNCDKGITLIILTITIIIMLILIAVAVKVTIDSGLIDNTKDAAKDTKNALEREKNISDRIEIVNGEYDTIEEYIGENWN